MLYIAVAKRSGDSIQFDLEENDPKEALDNARQEAYRIFNYKPGDPAAPTVSVKPAPGQEE